MDPDLITRLRGLPLVLDGTIRQPASSKQLAAAEARCGLRIPADLHALLSQFDGTTGPTSVDHGWITLWSADDLEPASGPTAGYPPVPPLIVFADYGVNSWWYAIEPGHPDHRPSAVHLLCEREPRILFPSLTDFLIALIADDSRLYSV